MIRAETLALPGERLRSPKTAELVAATLRRMIVDGALHEGDYLPNEAELTGHFGISRPTLREAIRVLESEQLVEVRRGSRTGARVHVPGPEILARPARLLLELSDTTVADVMFARAGFEPLAARFLAESGDVAGIDELEALVTDTIPEAWRSGRLAVATAVFHRRLAERCGNPVLAMIAGMLHEITVTHTAAVIKNPREVTQPQYQGLLRSYRRLLTLLRASDGEGAEAHWRRHMDVTREMMTRGLNGAKVREIAR
nr:GntR family transcriptional regulator [Mycobacterium sp. E796]